MGIPGIPRGRLGHWLRPAALGPRPELADVGWLAGRVISHAVALARAQDAPVHRAVAAHLGPQAAGWPVVSVSWPAFDQVNVQAGLDAWLARPGRRHELLGVTGFRHRPFGLADLTAGPPPWFTGSPGIGSVTTEARAAGPGGVTRACVTCGVYLVDSGGERIALLLRGPSEGGRAEGGPAGRPPTGDGPGESVSLEVTGADQARAEQVLDEVRRLAVEHNVYRGQVISFDAEVFGPDRSGLLSFQERPQIARSEVVLPPDLLDGIERQVLGIAQHAAALRASGQHLKRGVLLHGPPGTGKTHVVRYLIGRLSGVTVVLLSGGSLARIRQACSVARALQPAVVVVEDVDLIAEQRGPHLGQHPLLFQLLNEMDGLGADANVTFLLTTSRADILEEALAARPGRVDHTVRLPLPDAAARRRLLRLSQGRLHIGRSGVNAVVARTDGVTASFIKELLRRAALHAAVQADGRAAAPSPRHAIAPGPGQAALNGHASGPAPPLRVTARHLNRALDELLDSRNDLTRVLLGSRPARGLDSLIREPPGRRAPAGSRPRAPLTAPWPDPPRAAEPTHPG